MGDELAEVRVAGRDARFLDPAAAIGGHVRAEEFDRPIVELVRSPSGPMREKRNAVALPASRGRVRAVATPGAHREQALAQDVIALGSVPFHMSPFGAASRTSLASAGSGQSPGGTPCRGLRARCSVARDRLNPTPMDFHILGPLEVLDEGRALALGGSRQRALLALLLLHANETLTTDRLIDELWGSGAATAAKLLHVQVSRLRKALAAGGVDHSRLGHGRDARSRLRADARARALDAHRFEDLVAAGGDELAAGRPDRAAAALERALSLWRGAPLADLAYERFAQPEIARLEVLRVTALEQLVDAQLGLGRHAEVVGRLQALIAEHPYRERLRAQLMLALYRCDRQADALQAYQDARRALSRSSASSPASGCASSSAPCSRTTPHSAGAR